MNRLYGSAFVRGTSRLRLSRAGWSLGPRLCHTAAKGTRTATSVCLRLALAGTGVVVLGLFGRHRKSECERNVKSVSETGVAKHDTPTTGTKTKVNHVTLPAAIRQARDLVHRLKVCMQAF